MSKQSESTDKHSSTQEEDLSKKNTQKSVADSAHSENQELDALLSAFEGDLSAISHEAAINLLDQWYDPLHKSKEPHIKELASSLKELKQLLKGKKATGHEIGEILVEIGEHTGNIASDADKGLKTQLQKLGKQIKKAGTSIGKAEDKEHVENIDSLVDTLEGDLTAIDHETTLGAINHWYNLLHKSENEKIKEISNELKHLKQVLKRSNPIGSDIAESLVKLGEQTQEASHEAPRGLKGPIQRLGKLLSKTGKSLE